MALELAQAAAAYGRNGWAVFPIRAGAKEPLTPNGFKDATADAAQITRWWQETPDANVAVVPAQTGHVVIDIDGPEGEAAAQQLGLLTVPTLVVVTGAGKHLWFRHPSGDPIGNAPLAPHLDVRAARGYVLLPPSVHYTGVVYQWRGKLGDALPLPPEVAARLRQSAPTPAGNGGTSGEVIGEGARNQTLASLAGTLRRRGLDAEEIGAALLAINARRCQPPLGEEEVLRIAESVSRYTPALPLSPPAAAARPAPPTPLLEVPADPARQLTPSDAVEALYVRASEVQPVRVSWLWPLRIPLGKLTLITGDPELGKSTLLLDLAARITTGTMMPDGAPLPQVGGVVVLNAEDGEADTVVPRLRAAGADLERIVLLRGVRVEGQEHELILPDHLEAVRQAVAACQALMAIIDPLNAYLTGAINSWRDHDLRRALRPLARLAEELGVAVVASRHLNKANAGPALYRGGGSIAFTAAARAEFLVAADPDEPERRVVATIKANLAPHQPSLTFRLQGTDTGVARVVWGAASRYTANELVMPLGDAAEQDAAGLAVAWLKDALAEGARPSAEVEHAARADGIASRSLDRARSRLGVQARKVGGRDGHWELYLPEAAQRTPSSASLASFGPEAGQRAPDTTVSVLGALQTEQAAPEPAKSAKERRVDSPASFEPEATETPEADSDAAARDAMKEGA